MRMVAPASEVAPADAHLLSVFPLKLFEVFYDEVRQERLVRLDETRGTVRRMRASKTRHMPFHFASMDFFMSLSEPLKARIMGTAAVPSCPVYTSGLLMMLEPLGRFTPLEVAEDLVLLMHPDPAYAELRDPLQQLCDTLRASEIDHAKAYELLNAKIMPVLVEHQLAVAFRLAGRVRHMVDTRHRPGIAVQPLDPYDLTQSGIDVYMRYWIAWGYLMGTYIKPDEENAAPAYAATTEPVVASKHDSLRTPGGQRERLVAEINDMERRIMALCQLPPQFWPALLTRPEQPRVQDVSALCACRCDTAVRQLMTIELSLRRQLRVNIAGLRDGKALPRATVQKPPEPAASSTLPIVKRALQNQGAPEMTADQCKQYEEEAARTAQKEREHAAMLAKTRAAVATIKARIDRLAGSTGSAPHPEQDARELERCAEPLDGADVVEIGRRIRAILKHHVSVSIVPLAAVTEEQLEACAGAFDYGHLLTEIGKYLEQLPQPQS
jgi:hypothetical protein